MHLVQQTGSTWVTAIRGWLLSPKRSARGATLPGGTWALDMGSGRVDSAGLDASALASKGLVDAIRADGRRCACRRPALRALLRADDRSLAIAMRSPQFWLGQKLAVHRSRLGLAALLAAGLIVPWLWPAVHLGQTFLMTEAERSRLNEQFPLFAAAPTCGPLPNRADQSR